MRAYTIFGWVVWQLGKRLIAIKAGQNRGKLGAAGIVALVLVGGIVAARASSSDD